MRTAIFFWCLLWGIFPPVQAANGGPICQYAHKKEGLRLATCIHPASSNYLSTDDFDTLFQERFGNSFVESPGTSAYPSFTLEGWTGEAGLFMGTYLDGMTQVTIDVREIDLGPDANEDPPATEDLALLQDANYEASLVYATIGGIGVVAIVSTYSYEDGESVTTYSWSLTMQTTTALEQKVASVRGKRHPAAVTTFLTKRKQLIPVANAGGLWRSINSARRQLSEPTTVLGMRPWTKANLPWRPPKESMKATNLLSRPSNSSSTR